MALAWQTQREARAAMEAQDDHTLIMIGRQFNASEGH